MHNKQTYTWKCWKEISFSCASFLMHRTVLFFQRLLSEYVLHRRKIICFTQPGLPDLPQFSPQFCFFKFWKRVLVYAYQRTFSEKWISFLEAVWSTIFNECEIIVEMRDQCRKIFSADWISNIQLKDSLLHESSIFIMSSVFSVAQPGFLEQWANFYYIST